MPSGHRVCRLPPRPALQREGRREGSVAFPHALPALGQTAGWLSPKGNREGSGYPASSCASPRCLGAPGTSLLPQKAPIGQCRDPGQPQTEGREEEAGAVSQGACLGAKSEAHGLCCLPAQPVPPAAVPDRRGGTGHEPSQASKGGALPAGRGGEERYPTRITGGGTGITPVHKGDPGLQPGLPQQGCGMEPIQGENVVDEGRSRGGHTKSKASSPKYPLSS